MKNQVKGGERIIRRKPHQTAPTDVTTGTIMRHVHGLKVTALPTIELRNVKQLQCDAHKHGIRQAGALVLKIRRSVLATALTHVGQTNKRVKLASPEQK